MTYFDNEYTALNDEGIFQYSVTQSKTDKGTQRVLTRDFDTLKNIVRTETFVHDLSKGTYQLPLFAVERHNQGSKLIKAPGAHILLELLAHGVVELPTKHPAHIFSPAFMLFVRKAKKHSLEWLTNANLKVGDKELRAICKRLNDLIADIYAVTQKPKYDKTIRQHNKGSRKNFRRACQLVDEMFTRYKSLLVLRLDLHYLKQYQWTAPGMHAISLETCFENRAWFIDKLPQKITHDALVGYIWKTEFKLDKSIHHHFFIFLDATKVYNAVLIGKMLGEWWERECTDNLGKYFNVTAEYPVGHPDSFVGKIRARDTLVIERLKKVGVSYLCKPDYHIRWAVESTHRLFGTSALPKDE